MNVLVADTFEESGLDGLRAAGREVRTAPRIFPRRSQRMGNGDDILSLHGVKT
jgi:hypothetical protein